MQQIAVLASGSSHRRVEWKKKNRFSSLYTFCLTRLAISKEIFFSNTKLVFKEGGQPERLDKYRYCPISFLFSFYFFFFLEEKLRIELRCSTENCPVRIDRGSIRMEDTFLGLSRSKILTIHNRSNYIVKYKWMQLESIEADNERREQ